MKTHPRNQLFGYVQFIVIAVLAILILAIVGLVIHWQPERTVKRQQATLLRAVETKNAGKFRRLVSKEYQDRWEWNAENATEAMMDARSQFLAMVIDQEDQMIAVEGKKAVVETHLKLGGTTMNAGAVVQRKINQLEDPFEFTWQKQSFLPSSWRLVSIENKSIPDNVWGYHPGAIESMMESGF